MSARPGTLPIVFTNLKKRKFFYVKRELSETLIFVKVRKIAVDIKILRY